MLCCYIAESGAADRAAKRAENKTAVPQNRDVRSQSNDLLHRKV